MLTTIPKSPLLMLALLIVVQGGSARAQDTQLSAIRDLFFKGNFAEVISKYAQLPGDLRETPLVSFWVGQSYLREHDIEHAQEFLRKAEDGNLPPPQRERAQAALARLDTLKQLCPPFYHDYSLDGYTIRIFAKDSPWVKSIAAQMPTFLARAKEAFGSESAYVAFYLFEDRVSYDKFFEAWGPNSAGKEHRGTGGMHMVLFCRYYPTGAEIGGKNVSDLYFRVLHEYSHALCNTIYGDNFKMPQWLNEGLADYFGWKYFPLGSQQAKARLQQLALQRRARTYEEISTALYADSETGYATGDVMVSDLFQSKPLSMYGQIINIARSSGGNFEYALQQTTGRDPKVLYSQLVSSYWKGSSQ